MSRLGINTIVVSGATILAQGLAAITFWVVARSISPASFGVLAAAIGIATLLLTALDFGINSLTVRNLARSPLDVAVFVDTLSAKIVTSAVLGFTWTTFALLLLITTHPTWGPVVVLGAYIACSDIASTLNVVARSREQFHIPAITTVSSRLVNLGVTSALVLVDELAIYALPAGMVAGSLVSIAVAWWYLDPSFRRLTSTSPVAIASLWKSSAGFGLSGLAAQLQRLDVTIVAAVAGAASGGLYAAPARITGPLSVLPTALSTTLFSRVSRDGNKGDNRIEAIRAIGITTLVSSAGFAVLFIIAEPLVRMVLGDAYAASAPALRCFLVGLVLMSINAPLAAVLQAEGHEFEVARVVGRASIAGLIAVAAGAAMGGSTGAAAGYIVLQAVILLPLAAMMRSSSDDLTQLEAA